VADAWPGLHEILGSPRAHVRLHIRRDLGVHGQGRHHAHGRKPVQAPARPRRAAAQCALSVPPLLFHFFPKADVWQQIATARSCSAGYNRCYRRPSSRSMKQPCPCRRRSRRARRLTRFVSAQSSRARWADRVCPGYLGTERPVLATLHWGMTLALCGELVFV
jgi:hypothetical protein